MQYKYVMGPMDVFCPMGTVSVIDDEMCRFGADFLGLSKPKPRHLNGHQCYVRGLDSAVLSDGHHGRFARFVCT
eukprot:UN04522